jgi:magnesium chelatase family protein
MRSQAHTYITEALSVRAVTVEVDIRPGLPAFTIIGLGDRGVREIRDRVRAAILNSGYEFPPGRITVAVTPSDMPGVKPELDLALACALLAASGQTQARRLESHILFGELSLDGQVRSRPGALAVAQAASEAGVGGLILAPGCAREATAVGGLEIVVAERLSSAVQVLGGGAGDPLPRRVTPGARPMRAGAGYPDLSDIRGQQQGIKALTLAAAGGHNLLLSGPPGSGRSMLARRLPSIMAPLSRPEAIEVTSIHSIAGRLADGDDLVRERPFRAPHHTISTVGLVGGVRRGWIGEITLAHRGVLYLDELTEFDRSALQALGGPLKDGFVTVIRRRRSVVCPSRFILLAAVSPCPCGYLGEDGRCRCDEADLARYQRRLNSPLLDRVDLVAHLKRPDQKTLSLAPARTSAQTREQVVQARERQHARLRQDGITVNAEMNPSALRRHVALSGDCERLLREAQKYRTLSASGVHRVLRVARTAADLDGSDSVREQDLSLALAATSRSPGGCPDRRGISAAILTV